MKVCKKCGQSKALDDFPLDKTRSDGRHTYCRSCRVIEQKARDRIRFIEKWGAENRTCKRCNVSKTIDEFVNSRSRYQKFVTVCLKCKEEQILKYSRDYYDRQKAEGKVRKRSPKARILDRDRRMATKLELLELKGGKCLDCGEKVGDKYPGACFDFHHEGEKTHNIGHLIAGYRNNQDKVLEELDKCIILCANCHRKRHYTSNDPQAI